MTRAASSITDSTAFEGPSASAARHQRQGLAWIRRFASEPFVHFTLLGAFVFAANHLLTRTPDVPTIEVSGSKQRELFKLFEQRQRRAPDEAERKQLVQRHVEDEALFREGVRLSLVQTDPVLRAQVIARVQGLMQSELEQKPPTDSELRRYYDEHRADYAIPETIGYREYWIHRGPSAGSDARRLLQALGAGKVPDEELPLPTDYSARSEAQLISLYDEELGRALWALPNGSWQEIRADRGIFIVRVDQRTPGSQPAFAEVRESVSMSYRRDQIARASQAELARLTSQWRVNVAEAP